jgi:hypothetical protein
MEEIIKIALNWAVPLVLTTIFGFLVKIIKDNKAMKESMLSLIRSQIVGKCETYMGQGFLPEYARYCLEELFKQYQALGGNHGVETLVNNCYELPLSKKEEKKSEK